MALILALILKSCVHIISVYIFASSPSTGSGNWSHSSMVLDLVQYWFVVTSPHPSSCVSLFLQLSLFSSPCFWSCYSHCSCSWLVLFVCVFFFIIVPLPFSMCLLSPVSPFFSPLSSSFSAPFYTLFSAFSYLFLSTF